MEEGKNTAFGELKEIVAALRAENGCPWDRAQTHDSLRPCMLEEAAELLASIRIFHETGNPENMKEELGDVLLQVVMHSQIAAEEGLFTIEDVINGVSEKMVRRHPHVFRGEAWDQGTEPEHWEDIKSKEKESQSWVKSPLQEIPPELPALARAVKVLKKADKLYQKQPAWAESLAKIRRLADEMQGQEAGNVPGRLAELLLAAANLSRLAGISPELLLQDELQKMVDRLEPAAPAAPIKRQPECGVKKDV